MMRMMVMMLTMMMIMMGTKVDPLVPLSLLQPGSNKSMEMTMMSNRAEHQNAMKLKVKQIIIMIKEAHKGGPAKFYQNKTTKKMPIAHKRREGNF